MGTLSEDDLKTGETVVSILTCNSQQICNNLGDTQPFFVDPRSEKDTCVRFIT